MKQLKKWTTSLLLLTVFGSLSGCGSLGSAAKSMGISRRPLIEYVAPPSFDEAETATLTRWMNEDKALFGKIQKHSNKLADAVRVSNEEGIKINLKQVELVSDGDSDAARAAVRVQIQKAKYPPNHPIYKLVGEEKTP